MSKKILNKVILCFTLAGSIFFSNFTNKVSAKIKPVKTKRVILNNISLPKKETVQKSKVYISKPKLNKKVTNKKKPVKKLNSYYSLSSYEKTILQKIMYAEAGNQGYYGMALVGQVVMNRVNKNKSSVRSVIFAPKQFAPIRDGSFNRAKLNSETKKALNLVESGKLKHFNALYFVEKSSYRGWFKTLHYVRSYSSHIFLS